MTDYKKGDSRTVVWSREDTPIPKKGEILTTIFRTEWRVLGGKRVGNDYEIEMEMISGGE